MADKENNIVSVTFTYNLPDDYLHQTSTLGKTGEWTYTGPDKIWVMVNTDTNRYSGHFYTEAEDGEHYPTPLDRAKVFVDCTTNPLLCSIIGDADEARDYATLPQYEETLPCGNVYRRPETPTPDHTYDVHAIEYDPATGQFKTPYPWKQPHMTWDELRNYRNQRLAAHDHKAPDDAPQSVRDMWEAHREELRNLPQVHGASNTHIEIDLTAAAPINTAGQAVLKLKSVTGINIGDDVGVKEWFVKNIFEDHSRVVAINARSKLVTLDKVLVATPTDANKELAFSPCPETDPWKIQPIAVPDENRTAPFVPSEIKFRAS